MDARTDTIAVKLFAGLETRARQGRSSYEFAVAEAPTVGDLLAALGLEPGAAGLVLVNGLHAGPASALCPGDVVAVFPPLGGG